MKTIRSLNTMTAWSEGLRREGVTIGFVPTMVALHDGHRALIRAARLRQFLAAAAERPELAGLFTAFRTTVPQVKVELDREKVKTLGIPVNTVFDSLQTYLGGLLVNDFNRFGRT